MVRGTLWGYLPETTKIILVKYPREVSQVEAFFWVYGLQIVTGSRYLWGICGDGGGAGLVVGGECGGVASFCGHHEQGCGQAPADCISGST